MTSHETHDPGASARDWLPILDQYRTPNAGRSVFEILVTVAPFACLWLAAWLSLQWSFWLSLLFAIPSAGFLVRIFIIQHDCGHGSFFRRKRTNDWVGRLMSVLTFTPYELWRRSHATHHASTGNLERRGVGDITTLTVREYLDRSPRRQLAYRLYRHPLVMFGIGPAYVFLIAHRLPTADGLRNWRAWISPMTTNVAIAVAAAIVIYFVGFVPFLMVQLPIILLAGAMGVWLFYVQHQFEHTSWLGNEDWSVHEAALHGSSHYDLPAPLRWLTGNIGIHHVHHLCSRIPFYRLGRVLRDYPALRDIGRITVRESLACVRLTLWDEGQRRLVPFRAISRNRG